MAHLGKWKAWVGSILSRVSGGAETMVSILLLPALSTVSLWV